MITKNKIILWLSLISATLLVALVLAIVFKPKVKPIVPVTISNPNTSYLAAQHIDTVTIEHWNDPKPSVPALVDTVHIPIPIIQPSDTVYIVMDYFTGKTYLYTFKDSIINFKANIYINKNKVFTVDPEYTYKEKIITVTNDIVSIPKWSIAIGGGVSYGQSEADINFDALITRNRHMFGGYYGILRKEIGVSYKYIILYK